MEERQSTPTESPTDPDQSPFSVDNQPYHLPEHQKFDDSVIPVHWSASEFIAHQKSFAWYTLLIIGGIGLAAIIYLLTRDKVSTTIIVIVSACFAFIAARKPKVANYTLDNHGITIDEKFYDYRLFKSFSIMVEGAIPSVSMLPLRRFATPRNIYFAPSDEEKIITALAQYLPQEQRKPDAVDQFIYRIRL